MEQRDHWKSEFDKLSYILRMFPYSTAQKSYQESLDRQAKLARERELSITQALLLNENERLKRQIEALQKVADANEHPF